MSRFLNDEAGSIISVELILVATILVIGAIVGIASVRDSVISEIADMAGGVQALNQCYSVSGIIGHAASTCGFDFFDYHDFCDDGPTPACITFDLPPANEG